MCMCAFVCLRAWVLCLLCRSIWFWVFYSHNYELPLNSIFSEPRHPRGEHVCSLHSNLHVTAYISSSCWCDAMYYSIQRRGGKMWSFHFWKKTRCRHIHCISCAVLCRLLSLIAIQATCTDLWSGHRLQQNKIVNANAFFLHCLLVPFYFLRLPAHLFSQSVPILDATLYSSECFLQKPEFQLIFR